MNVTELPETQGITTSVHRAMRVLDCFRASGPLLGVTELARRTGLPKSTAFRLLNSMIACGYVERVGPLYRLGSPVFELGARATSLDPDVREDLLPLLIDLSSRSGYTVHVGVLQGSDVLYVEKIPGRAALRTPTAVGTRLPASCTAMGKSLLAHSESHYLEEIVRSPLTRRTPYSVVEPRRLIHQVAKARGEGLAFDAEETTLGLTCVAAPLMHRGRAWAAISLSGPPTLARNRALHGLVPDVARKASAIYTAFIDSTSATVNA